jgi:hypothetical protein
MRAFLVKVVNRSYNKCYDNLLISYIKLDHMLYSINCGMYICTEYCRSPTFY